VVFQHRAIYFSCMIKDIIVGDDQLGAKPVLEQLAQPSGKAV
jgi:hypothetical protein